MRIRVNHNKKDLYCLYSKEPIEIGDKYVEVIEDYFGEKIVKTYSFWYLEELTDAYLEEYDIEPDIEFDERVDDYEL